MDKEEILKRKNEETKEIIVSELRKKHRDRHSITSALLRHAKASGNIIDLRGVDLTGMTLILDGATVEELDVKGLRATTIRLDNSNVDNIAMMNAKVGNIYANNIEMSKFIIYGSKIENMAMDGYAKMGNAEYADTDIIKNIYIMVEDRETLDGIDYILGQSLSGATIYAVRKDGLEALSTASFDSALEMIERENNE